MLRLLYLSDAVILVEDVKMLFDADVLCNEGRSSYTNDWS